MPMLIPNRSERITAPRIRILSRVKAGCLIFLLAGVLLISFAGCAAKRPLGGPVPGEGLVAADLRNVLEKMREKWYKKGLSAYALWVNNL
jgi:hypothetical protein